MPLLIAVCLVSTPAEAQYGGGTGEPNDPYLIYTAEQMNEIGARPTDWDKHFKLMADVDLGGFTGTEFNIIGHGAPFTGVFDGDGHTISHFTYTSTASESIGLFSDVSGLSGMIKNIKLSDPNVDAGSAQCVGALVGYMGRGSVISCCVDGGSVIGHYDVGGLVGYSWSSLIRNCYTSCTVVGDRWISGLVGGLGPLKNCYSVGEVHGDRDVGGLTMTRDRAGYPVYDSFWDVEASGQPVSGSGVGLTTAQMQDVATFVDAGWGCDGAWTIDDGNDYPRLRWENRPGRLITGECYTYGGGTGTAEDPYLIYTAEQLYKLGTELDHWDKHLKLMSDIDLNESSDRLFTIGVLSSQSSSLSFSGVFDGNGHTIFNLHSPWGFFGSVSGPDSLVMNLRLVAPRVTGYGTLSGALVAKLHEGTVRDCAVWECDDVMGGFNHDTRGGLVGRNVDGTIQDCHVSGKVKARCAGGIVGDNGGTILDCGSSAVVDGWGVGGLVGWNQNMGIISNCCSSGDVSGHVYSTGGLVGSNSNGCTITNCYATGSVSGQGRVGGLVGDNWDTISNCYSVGIVTGTTNVGGLVGLWEASAIEESFWDIESSGQTFSDGGRGRTTAEMQTASTFTDAGWDFAEVWCICEGTRYPRLLSQVPVVPGVDFNGDEKVDFRDFPKLAEYWLQDAVLLETAPATSGYCTVYFEYVAVFAENWLADFCRTEFSLLAHWKFDETEGHIAHDSVGGSDAGVLGDPLWRPAGGKVDGALELDGIDDFVITYLVLNPADSPFKVSAWVKGGAPGQVIISQSDAGLGSAWLWASPSDGKLMTSLMYPEPPLESESVITDGDWHEIGLMWDECHRHLYVDGAEVAKDTDIVDPAPADGVLLFGFGKGAGSFFSGLIDDVRIYEGKYILEEEGVK